MAFETKAQSGETELTIPITLNGDPAALPPERRSLRSTLVDVVIAVADLIGLPALAYVGWCAFFAA
jgi:hypothetical protein